MNHFTAIGVPLYSEADVQELLTPLLKKANQLESTTPGFSYLIWEAGQGSEIWFQYDEKANTVRRTKPAFKGATSLAIRITSTVENEDDPLESLLQGWVNPEGNDTENGDYPMVFTWLDKGLHRPMEYPHIHHFQITAFAQELKAYPSEDAYLATTKKFPSGLDDDAQITIAPESFIPAGMFVEEGDTPDPTAMFTGRVLEVKELASTLNDEPFYWFRVKTFGGEYDVVASSDVIEGELDVGGIISGVFWLYGRIIG